MMSAIQTEYLTLSNFKTTLGIDEDRTNNDEKLLNIITITNDEIDSRLRPVLGNSPIPRGTETYVQAAKCAMSHARSLWYEHTGQFERAKFADEQYEKKIEKLIAAIYADKPERTQAVFIPGASQDPLLQPYNVDQYITREF